MVRIADVFADDAQHTSDPEWIRFGTARGWIGLTKDQKIRRSAGYSAASGPIVSLSSGQLTWDVMIERFDRHRDTIWALAGHEREFWVVYGDRIVRRDP